MADLFFPEVDVNQRATALGLEILPATFGEGFGAAFEETLTRNPLPSVLRSMERARYRDGRYVDEFGNEQTAPATPAKLLSAEEANERYGIKGKLKFDSSTPEPIAENLFRLKTRELELQDIRRRADAGIGTALTAGLVGSLLDPLNVGLAFVPVVGPARMAAMTSRMGAGGARTTTGAIEGAVGAMLVEPIVLGVAREEQADYTAVDSLMNLAFGTAIGGGLHFGAGYIGDRVRGRDAAKSLSRLVDDLPQQDQAALLRTAVAQLAEGRLVDVSPVLSAAQPVLGRAAQLAEARVRLAELSEIPAFLRTAEDVLAFRNATETLAEAKRLSPEMKRAVEILQTPGFLRSQEDKIFLAGLKDVDDAAPEWKAKAEALVAKIERGDSPADFVEAAQMAVIRAGKENVLRKLDYIASANAASAPEVRAQALEQATRDIAEGVYDREFAVDTRAAELQSRAAQVAQANKEAALRTAVDKAHERPVDPADQRASAAAEQRVLDEANAKSLDDEAARIQEEVTELEKHAPEGEEPSQAVKDAAKEASLFTKAWQAAAACGLRKS